MPVQLPRVTKKVLNVPWHNPRYPRVLLGGYVTCKRRQSPEEHALLHTAGLDSLDPRDPVLLRINSACFTGDIFHDELCDCNHQLVVATEMIQEHSGPGLILYHFKHEGKSHGWTDKLLAYRDQMFSVEGDKRDFTPAVAILRDLGVERVVLITNNPEKRQVVENYGIEVVKTVPIISADPNHAKLLTFKRDCLGHQIPHDFDALKAQTA